MTERRRYGEDEVAEILDRATDPEYDLARLPKRAGLTLAQIQEIGSEAGIAADRIKRAAQSMALSTVTANPPATLFGVERAVERTVHIERALSDEEWSRLVAQLRQRFGGEGYLEAHGTLRSWHHLGTTVHLEPSGEGYRVRMRAEHTDLLPLFGAGIAAIVGAIGLLVLITLNPGSNPEAIRAFAGLFGLGGVGSIAVARTMLPRWSAKRSDQFEGVAQSISLLTDSSEAESED